MEQVKDETDITSGKTYDLSGRPSSQRRGIQVSPRKKVVR